MLLAIFRGQAALVFLVFITIVMFIDVLRGNTESFQLWLGVIVVSFIFTLIASLFRRYTNL